MTPIRSLSALVLGCLLLVSVEASLSFDKPPAHLANLASHRQLAHRRSVDSASPAKVRRGSKDSKRCKTRDTSSNSSSSSSSSSSSPSPSSETNQNNDSPKKNNNKPHVSNANVATGLINVQSNCGDIGATKDVTATTGPNGKMEWLNCGLTDGGWHPPYVKVNDLVTKDLSEAVSEDNSPFKACSEYIDLFNKYGWANNIPPIMLASFAMQESSCKPWTVGGAGEQGLMQLTKDKCGDAPGGDCKNPDFNIRKGAEYIAQSLQDNGGSVLLTIGRYNGWYEGMTYGDATSAMYTSCCRCQKNCDYLHQFVNGWLQNVDAYTVNPPLGQFFNLNKCN